MVSAIQTSTAGIRSASDRFDDVAQRIASATGGGVSDRGPATQVDLSSAVVDMMTAKIDFEMNVAVLRTADEMQKHLIDVIA